MYERDDLLHAIQENPDDDAPRLAYADWLDEHGDPSRAAVIRLQVDPATYGEALGPHLPGRLRALEWACARRLRARLPAVPGIRYQWDRGFPVAVADTPAAAAAFLDCRLPPEVAGLRLRRLRNISGLAGRPRLRLVRQLSLAGCRVYQGYAGAALATSPNLAGLVRLDLADTNASVGFVYMVTRNPVLAALRTLNLAGNRRQAVGDLIDFVLAAWPALADLDLSRIEPTAEVLCEWVSDPAIARLATLRLNRNQLGDSGAVTLAMSPHLGNLDRLELRGNGITELGARLLADAPHLGKLSVLDLQHNPIPPAAVAVLRARFGKNVRLDS